MGRVADWGIWRQRLNLKQDLAQEGWNLEGNDPEANAQACVFIYYNEPMTDRFSIMGRLPIKAMLELDRRAKKRQLPKVEDMTGVILDNATSASNAQANTLVSKKKRQRTFDDLLLSCAAYLVQTRTYAELKSRGLENGHFLVNNYVWPGEEESYVRPFALINDGMIPADEILSYAHHVLSLDREKHPEWFPSASVHNFPNGNP